MASDDQRTMGLWAATGVGVGAIVGGGILALTGVAFATAGPGAILAFALNGVLAFLTAMSFAEVSSKFPESGGAYVFAKKVLSVEAAVIVGWVVWFASIAAAALYAIGFASFALLVINPLLDYAGGLTLPGAGGRAPALVLAGGATLAYTVALSRTTGGGGPWANIGKVVVFGVLILGGTVVAARGNVPDQLAQLSPFAPFGFVGILQAMGFTFIALQGFDLIAAVSGEVKQPERNIPRAMFFSLGIALIIYMPLLLLVCTIGVPEGTTISELSRENPEAVVAVAAGEFLGPFGYWLVAIAGVFSMLTALQANVLAASHVARTMARDRTLPKFLRRSSAKSGSPAAALWFTAFIICGVLMLIPNVQSAGAAASLIFLISFALVHWMSILLRKRSVLKPPPFRTPFFPAIPLIGGLGCVALAIFQGVAAPDAGVVAAVWLGIGAILFIVIFARSARLADVGHSAIDPEIIQLRGSASLVLVPISNPNNAQGLVAVAQALAPPMAGRVLLSNIVRQPETWDTDAALESLANAQSVLRRSFESAAESGVYPETLITVSDDPWKEIAGLARHHQCGSVLLGLSTIDASEDGHPMDRLLDSLASNVVVLRAPTGWTGRRIERILVPQGGKGGHENLLARLLGSFYRTGTSEVTFLRVLPESASPRQVSTAETKLRNVADDVFRIGANVEVVRSSDPAETIAKYADQHDLVILGVNRSAGLRRLVGKFTSDVAQKTDCPLLVISYYR